MRLDFNVLWVEDQPDNVKAQFDRIEFLIRKEGFRLQVKFAGSVEEAKQYLSEDIFGDHVDLILMDYDLGSGRMGDDGLVEVRNIFRYKDVVFYSARAADLLTLVAAKKIQGVFCSTRLELPDTVNGVFEALVKKVLDIDHSRGIIMGATSDIDYVVNDCLSLTCGQVSGKFPENVRKIIGKRMAEIRKRFEKDAAAIDAIGKVEDLFELHNVYTSVDRLNLLRKVLAETGQHEKYHASMKNYVSETVPKRNVLAHVKVQREGFSRKLFDGKGKELTCDQMRELRLALLQHQEVFEALAADLKGVGQPSAKFL